MIWRHSLRAVCIAGDHFPLEARHHLAPWIDQNFTADLDLGNPQHEEHAQRLVMELVAQLESKARPQLLPTNTNYKSHLHELPTVSQQKLGIMNNIYGSFSFEIFPPKRGDSLWSKSLELTYLMIIIFPVLYWIRLEYFDQNEVLLSIRLPGTSLIISKNSFKFCVPKPT